MSGEELKDLLQKEGVSQSELARKFSMTQQAFNQALKVADVKSGLLEKIAEALGRDMSFFYSSCAGVTTTGDNNTVQVGNNNSVVPKNDDDEEIDLGLDDMCDLKEEIAYLREHNKMLMNLVNQFMKKSKIVL